MTKFRDRESFTALQIEGALCAWEFMIDEMNLPDGKVSVIPDFKSICDNLGMASLRCISMQAGAISCDVYAHMESQGYEFTMPYDWEFVPAVVRRLDWQKLIDDNQFAGAPYVADVATILAEMIAATPGDFHKRDLQGEWINAARREAERQWCYAGLIEDHSDKCEAAFASGEKPADFVRLLGEDYGLTPAASW